MYFDTDSANILRPLPENEAKRLAREHWEWAAPWLETAYREAFEHGFQHGFQHGIEWERKNTKDTITSG